MAVPAAAGSPIAAAMGTVEETEVAAAIRTTVSSAKAADSMLKAKASVQARANRL